MIHQETQRANVHKVELLIKVPLRGRLDLELKVGQETFPVLVHRVQDVPVVMGLDVYRRDLVIWIFASCKGYVSDSFVDLGSRGSHITGCGRI